MIYANRMPWPLDHGHPFAAVHRRPHGTRLHVEAGGLWNPAQHPHTKTAIGPRKIRPAENGIQRSVTPKCGEPGATADFGEAVGENRNSRRGPR